MQNKSNATATRISAAHLKVPSRRLDAPAEVPASVGVPAPRRSAAGLTAPKRKPPAQPAPTACGVPLSEREKHAAFDRLRKLRNKIRPSSNKPDLATALIHACILEGICSTSGIVRTLVHLGLDNRFAGAMINAGAKARRWLKNADGRYYLPSRP